MSLQNFITAVKTGGLARPSKFQVIIPRPSVINDLRYKSSNDWAKMQLFCDQATLPGVNYSTTQARTYGEFREMPYERTFDPLTLSFYCDSDMWIKGFFDEWMANIQNTKSRTFQYYEKYTVDMEIQTLTSAGELSYGVKIYECYPKSMTAINLDYSAKDVMKLGVTMQYRYWEKIEYARSPSQQESSQFTTAPQISLPQVIRPQDLAQTFDVNFGNVSA